MKKTLRNYLATLFGLFPLSLLAASVLLVQDAPNILQAPKAFRSTSQQPEGKCSKAGLDRLHLMGSGQFSENNLKYIITHYQKPTYIFDLRLESHGFLNGMAVSWYGKRNWANLNKSDLQITNTENQLLTEIKSKNEVFLHKIITKTKGIIQKTQPLRIKVVTVNNEKEIAQKNNIHYVRFFVADHRRPKDQEVDRFVKLMRTIPEEKWIYIHCRGGKGRTTSFMSMIDMMRNAKSVSFEGILERQYQLGGQNLFKKVLPVHTFASQSIKRISFLRDFYEYCRENKDQFKTSWLEWKVRNKPR